MEKITVAVGDIHGCLEEFDELLKLIQYKPSQMRLVSLGDLMDRGPDPVGVVRRVRELGLETVMGNHEEKHLRWRKHEKKRAENGTPNPMKRMSEVDAAANAALSDQDMSWMRDLPLKIHLGCLGTDAGDNWWAVHAGCEPTRTLGKQHPSQIMRVRYVDESGRAVALGPTLDQPEGTVYWATKWRGPESIIYGHCVHSLTDVRIDIFSPATPELPDIRCVGIDTGCCFGGHLTACFMKPNGDQMDLDFVQVKAKKKYYEGHGE
jgi:bis(5'-nucleosyl)-tetraphosphatase (symmetrical)